MRQRSNQFIWSLFKSSKMGHTYRKEKSFDEYGRGGKKRLNSILEKKYTKNQNMVFIEDEEDYEEEEEHEFEQIQSDRQK